jgi:predicted nucleotidyltransferase
MSSTIDDCIDRVVTVLKGSGAQAVFMFGSAVKGTLRDDSDIDLAVSGLPPDQFFKVFGIVSELSARPLQLIDLDESTPFTRYLKEEDELQRMG